MVSKDYYVRQSELCRKLALGTLDDARADQLHHMAEEFEAKAIGEEGEALNASN